MTGRHPTPARTPAPPDWRARLDSPADREIGKRFESERLADSYSDIYDEQTPVGELLRARRRLVLELLAGTSGGTLLNAGCGAGQMSRFLLERRPGDFSITALDRSQMMIDAARSVIGDDAGVRFVVGRIELMPFDDASFDVALALGVLEYVVDVRAAVEDLARVVKPGGLVVVSMQNRFGPFRLWERTVFPRLARLRGSAYEVEERPVDERPLRRILEGAGLVPVDAVYYNFNLFLKPLDYWFPERSMQVARRLAPLGRSPMRRLAADLLIAARRT